MSIIDISEVKPGSHVTLHYRLALADGADIVNTFTDKPATLLLGAGHLAPPLATLRANAIIGEDFSPGDLVEFNAPGGGRYAGVLKEVGETSALFDFNHPLAGQALTFEVKIIGIL